jgi:hypothetical protein
METADFGDDVEIEEVSADLLRISINGVPTDVFVERTFRMYDHFGAFRSLEHVVRVLRALQEGT